MADQNVNQPNRELSPELQAFEAQLASLLPSTGRLERDRLMFEAGKAAAEAERKRPTFAARWARSASSILITAAATFLLTSFVLQPAPVAVNGSLPKPQVPPELTIDTRQPLTAPSVPEAVSPPDEQAEDLFHTLLTSVFPGTDRINGKTNASYFQQRNKLLALGADRLPELTKTPPAYGAHSNTRVSYRDLLDELKLEMHGLAPGDSGSDQLKPSKQGTDL
jgi:hypothetical protein